MLILWAEGFRGWACGFRVHGLRDAGESFRQITAVASKAPLRYLVVSLYRGTPIYTLIYYSHHYGEPQNGTPDFGKPPFQYVDSEDLGVAAVGTWCFYLGIGLNLINPKP